MPCDKISLGKVAMVLFHGDGNLECAKPNVKLIEPCAQYARSVDICMCYTCDSFVYNIKGCPPKSRIFKPLCPGPSEFPKPPRKSVSGFSNYFSTHTGIINSNTNYNYMQHIKIYID